MDAMLLQLPYYVSSLAAIIGATLTAVAIRKRLRAPYYALAVVGSAAWAAGFLLLAITAGPTHPLRAEAATLIRSIFLAGGTLQLLWLACVTRSMVGVGAR